MPFSGSTRNRRPEAPAPLWLLLAGEDHPKACTGRRLIARRQARSVARIDQVVPAPIVLDPYAPEPLSSADRPLAGQAGILAVDCSWNRLGRRGRFPGAEEERRRPGVRRRLPILVAANPQHYGRISQLNTVEALSAALFLLGRQSEARALLEGFRGGATFLEINRDRLERYARCPTPEEIRAAERALLTPHEDPAMPGANSSPTPASG